MGIKKMVNRKKIKLDSLDFLLKLAEHTREAGASWAGGYTLDRKVLEFAQAHKIVTYREIREIIRKKTVAKKTEKILTNEAEKNIELPSAKSWTVFSLQNPVIFPIGYEKGKKTQFANEMKAILETNSDINEKYEIFKKALEIAAEVTRKVDEWISLLFFEGKLERLITIYQLSIAKKQKRTFVGRELLGNLIAPEKTKIILQKGAPPSLTVGEREAFQFLLWKANNLTKEELIIKNDFILEGKEEDIKKNGLIVIFEEQEALKKGYGEDMTFSGPHYAKLKKSMKSLLEKRRKLLITKETGNLELSISLIDKLEMTFTPTGRSEGKKYIMARIPCGVINYHGKYTAFPSNHFALLRTTPPKFKVDKTETRFFDILHTEKPYKKEQARIIHRIKNNFLLIVGGKKMITNRHSERVAKNINTIYAPKAVNLGLLKSFKEDLNREGEKIYIIEYEKHEVLEKYLGGNANQQ